MFGECDNCRSSDLKEEDFEKEESSSDSSSESESDDSEGEVSVVTFYKWGRQDGKIVKQSIKMDVADAIVSWNDSYESKDPYS